MWAVFGQALCNALLDEPASAGQWITLAALFRRLVRSASHLHQEGVELAEIRLLGRGKSLQTLNHYIQEVSAALVLRYLSVGALTHVDEILASAHLLRLPPQLPWHHFFSRRHQIAAHHNRFQKAS